VKRRKEENAPRRIAVRVHTRHEGQTLKASVGVVGEPDIAQGGSVELALFHYHLGKIIYRRKIRRLLPSFSEEVSFPMGPIASGNSWFYATFTDRYGQKFKADVIQDQASSKTWWLGSREGVSRKVLAPWTPLETRSSGRRVSVSCWGREYEFSGASFIKSVRSAGASLLSGPMRIQARVNGREVSWRSGALESVAEDRDIAVFNRVFTGGGLRLAMRTEVEFDGMIRFDWSVSSRRRARVESLVVEIPIAADRARYLYTFPGKWGTAQNASAFPSGGAAFPFVPYLWVGDEERGLAWFCESQENWFTGDANRAVEVSPEGERAVIRLHMVSAPVAMLPAGGAGGQSMTGLGTEADAQTIQGLRYTMGLQATPVKPVVKDAWDYRTVVMGLDQPRSEENITLDYDPSRLDKYVEAGIRAVIIFEQWTNFEGHAIPADRVKLKRLIKASHDRGLDVLLYFGFLISDLAPEWKEFGKECIIIPKGGYPVFHYRPQPDQSAWKVCLRSVWQDMVVAGVARVMDELDVDGVYLDGTVAPFGCSNTLHGCGALRPDGAIAPSWPIFAVRNVMRRIYQVVQSRKPGGQVIAHNSTCMTIPSVAWATSTWDGEQFQTMTKASELAEQLSLDAFRAEFMGRQWGVPAEFLCYSNAIPFKNAWAITLLHDVPIRPVRFDEEVPLISALWRVMDDFGRKEAEWLPYWRNAEYVRSSPPGVLVSLYRHRENGVLAVLSNVTRRKVSAEARFDMERLGLHGRRVSVSDALTGRRVDARGGRVKCELSGLDWKLIWLRE